MKKVALVIPSYNGTMRLSSLLQSIELLDSNAINLFEAVLVVHDPDPQQPRQTLLYDELQKRFPWITLWHLQEWSNMHGAAQKAFQIAEEMCEPEWIVYLGDDVLITPGALTNMCDFLSLNELRHVSLVQFPYWNAHDLSAMGFDGSGSREWHPHGPNEPIRNDREFLLQSKEDMYTQGFDWLRRVPRNPHWDGPSKTPRLYINVNGVGFACKKNLWRAVGGFPLGTWCLDESISLLSWRSSTASENNAICTLPGPPLVHFFGGATTTNPQQHVLHTEEAWTAAMGMDKQISGIFARNTMELAIEAEEELRRLRYKGLQA